MATHTRPGTGKPTYRLPAENLHLGPDAETARSVFWGLVAERVARIKGREAPTGVDHRRLAAARAQLCDTEAGELLEVAVAQAGTVGLPWTRQWEDLTAAERRVDRLTVDWDLVVALHAVQARWAEPHQPVGQPDLCRHGVPFTATCPECEADA